MDTELRLFRKTLKQHGHFITKPRYRLFKALQEHNTLTIHELIALLDHHDQATVYRNIKLFEELGIISRLHLGWHSKLELSDVFQHHHHHLTCTNCGRIISLPENTILETAIARLSLTKNFKPIDHQLEIRGLCQTCQKI